MSVDMDRDALRTKYCEERDKRLRTDGNEQYVEVTGIFEHYVDDPYVESTEREPLLPAAARVRPSATNRPDRRRSRLRQVRHVRRRQPNLQHHARRAVLRRRTPSTPVGSRGVRRGGPVAAGNGAVARWSGRAAHTRRAHDGGPVERVERLRRRRRTRRHRPRADWLRSPTTKRCDWRSIRGTARRSNRTARLGGWQQRCLKSPPAATAHNERVLIGAAGLELARWVRRLQ